MKSLNSAPLTRRNLIKGIAALMGSQALPASKLLPILEAETIGWPSELLQAIPIARLFCVNHDPGLIFREQDLIEANFHAEGRSVGFNSDRQFQLAFGVEKSEEAKRLNIAWQSNLSRSIKLLRQAKHIEEAGQLGITITPREFFSILDDPHNIQKLADIIYKEGRHVEFLPDYLSIDGWSEVAVRGAYRVVVVMTKGLTRWYPKLREAETFEQMGAAIRHKLSEALLLPLEDGCFDIIGGHASEPNALQILLREVPELFPQNKIDIFRKVSDEISRNGRQTTRISELSKDEWRIDANDLPYTWGYTRLQVAWPIRAAPVLPITFLTASLNRNLNP